MEQLDLAAKTLLRVAVAPLAEALVPGVRPGARRPTELVWRRRQADEVFALRGARASVVHFEVQATPRAEVPVLVLQRNALLRSEHRHVKSVVLYLRRARKRGPPRNSVEDEGLRFVFQTIEAWKQKAEDLLEGRDEALCALVPYARGATRSQVREAMGRLERGRAGRRDRGRAAARRADLCAVLATFAADRFPGPDWFAMIPKELRMKSALLQQLVAEGKAELEAKGRAEGKAEGKAEVLLEILTEYLGRQGARRLRGRLQRATPAQIRRMVRLLRKPLPEAELMDRLMALLPERSSTSQVASRRNGR